MTNVTEDEDSSKMISRTPEPAERQPRGKKRARGDDANASSTIGKIRHLKKEDGEPLWRKDIQYDFLKAVFSDEQNVFTNSYESGKLGKQCFADLYIDTMSRSTKTSKVLRDKLLSDREAAKGMAMVCLLVNIGRMNTTLNFFPEMRAQLRTYHAIPSLQAHQDPHAYKQLQDAPRLKSILKGGAEDRREPQSLDDIKAQNVPRTNPVNLLFVICQSATKIAELHFPPGREFHDLIMKTNLSSRSRARAFLWLMWFYLESDFTEEGCDENPFGPGVDYGVDVANQGVPRLDPMTKEEEALENQDPQEEVDFGFAKQKTRAKIIEADQQFIADNQTKRGGGSRKSAAGAGGDDGPSTGILPRIRPSKHQDSDIDSVRSTPPPRSLAARQSGAGSVIRRGAAGLKYQLFEGSSPGGGTAEGIVARKPRPPTAHQLAVERNRTQHVEYILDRGIRKSHHKFRKARRAEGSLVRALNRLGHMTDPFEDSDDDDCQMHNKQLALMGGPNGESKGFPYRERGFGGLCQLRGEDDDFGEEFATFCASIRRTQRRLERWEAHEGPELGVIQPIKRARQNRPEPLDDDLDGEGSPSKDAIDPAETEDETELVIKAPPRRRPAARRAPRPKANGRRSNVNGDTRADDSVADIDADGDTQMEIGNDLDDVDKELLGLAEDDDGPTQGPKEDDNEGEEDLDDADRALLGMDTTMMDDETDYSD
ncbi:INO80 chromatin remodeling complex Ies1-like protein [Thozetella sp. PMI_491]|nr:INO80 chromatin remodeling complex Ies1-like protein [Thozetella sp. PMI_491]